MSKLSYQAKVYNMLKEAGEPVSVERLLSIEGLLPYKLSAYVLYARGDYGAVIQPIRDGRKVVAYQLMDAGNRVPTRKIAMPVIVETEVEATRIEEILTEEEEVETATMKNDKIVDVLDEMDTYVSSYEDREFAEEFVRSL